MIKLSERAERMTPSETLAMASKAREMKARGIDVISFATGEPDFDTPQAIREAGKMGIDRGLTRYAPSAGIPELRRAIVSKLARDNSLTYSDDEIVVTCGAKQAIYNALQVIIDPGDDVLIPAPYWVSYPEQVKLAGGNPVIVPTGADTMFKVTPKTLKKFVDGKTRAVILNSPSNPSGSAYTAEELKALGEFFVERNIAIISDEIYEKLVYDGFVHTSIAAAHPPCRNMTIVINGVSKAFAMTGWRMGYAAGPREIISKMSTLVGQQISGIPGFVQTACLEALDGPQDEIEGMRSEFQARRDLMLEIMLQIRDVSCPVPVGAFYLLPDMSSYLDRRNGIDNSTALAEHLLSDAHIATVSGDPFGAPRHVRFSYATSRKNIREGMKRLKGALERL